MLNIYQHLVQLTKFYQYRILELHTNISYSRSLFGLILLNFKTQIRKFQIPRASLSFCIRTNIPSNKPDLSTAAQAQRQIPHHSQESSHQAVISTTVHSLVRPVPYPLLHLLFLPNVRYFDKLINKFRLQLKVANFSAFCRTAIELRL